MKYVNANTILPEELIKRLQDYIEGGYIYVPTTKSNQKSWGEVSGYRKELSIRNNKIIKEYQEGISMDALAKAYNLSIYAIRKIIYKR